MPHPRLTGDVRIAPDKDALFDDLAAAMIGCATQAVADRGVFHLALSGGSTPEPFYMHLVIDPRYRHFPWDKTHLWMVDERRVPEDDPRNNFRMIRETLADHVPMRSRQRHPMPVMEGDPATAYEAELREVFAMTDTTHPSANHHPPSAIPRLDFILLGMGDDAHTASLFPHSPALGVADRVVAVNEGDRVTPPPRVTMTYPLLNAGRTVAILVTGEKKAATIRRVERQLATAGPDPAAMPITGIDPTGDQGANAAAGQGGTLVWYLDAAAAGDAV